MLASVNQSSRVVRRMALVEKRARSPSGDEAPGGELIVAKKPKSDALTVAGVARTSNLTAPIMQLSGHGGEVLLPPKPEDSQDWAEREALILFNCSNGCVCLRSHVLLRAHVSQSAGSVRQLAKESGAREYPARLNPSPVPTGPRGSTPASTF
jgi:hypothetical protein